jgi:hypothetical protein
MRIQGLGLACLLLALAGCTGKGTLFSTPAVKSAPRAAIHEPQLPGRASAAAVELPVATRRLIESTGKGSLSGNVSFRFVTDAYFGDSAASLRLLALPAAHALITVTSLDEDLFTKDGKPISITSDTSGAFKLSDCLPTDRPVVVNALLAGDHKLSALVLGGQATVTLDEASSAVVEQLRWNLSTAGLAGLTSVQLADLVNKGAAFLDKDAFKASGTVPAIAALKSGQGLALRNAFVNAMGSKVTRGGSSAADTLSDLWRTVLGYRPLALTRVPGINPTDLEAVDGAMDADGNLFIAPPANFIIYVPSKDRAPLPGTDVPLKKGVRYSLVGQVNGGDGPGTLDAYNALYHPKEVAAVADPGKAPFSDDAGTVWLPSYLAPEQVAGKDMPHLFFTSRRAHRLYLVPGSDFTRYGRSFQVGRIYTLAGFGAIESPGAVLVPDDPGTPNVDEQLTEYLIGDGGPAHQAPLAFPLGVTQDSRHNLYVADTGSYTVTLPSSDAKATYNEAGPSAGLVNATYHSTVRLIRASDGKIFSFHLVKDGQVYPLFGAQDLRVVESAAGNFVYVVDSMNHCLIRFALPANLADLDTSVPATCEVENVLGKRGTPGFLADGQAMPSALEINDGIAKDKVLLDFPTSLEVDLEGNLLVADTGRLRMLDAAGNVFMLAGALNAGYQEGDSRLVTPLVRYLHRQPTTGDMLMVDDPSHAILHLWSGRGTR